MISLKYNYSIADSLNKVVKSLIERADTIFCTSKQLTKVLKDKYKKEIVFLPNGIDFSLSNNSVKKELPSEYRGITEPIVVYMGAINQWFDMDIMHYLCTWLKKVRFFLIVLVGINVTKLKYLQNLSILGPREYVDIPKYLSNAHIGIISFKKNEFTDYIHPIKLYEYFACGLGVVSTDLVEVREIGSPAFLAKSYQEFVDYISYLIENPLDRNKAFEFAKKHTWNESFNRVQKILDL